MSKTTPQPQQSEPVQTFNFPLFGFTCEATNLEEASSLLQSFLNNQ